MRLTLSAAAVALAVCASGSAFAQSASGALSHPQVIELAGQNKITMPMEFWSNPRVGMMGIEGFGADGNWYELVVDTQGKVVRAGPTDSKEPAVKMAAAADAAMKNGIAKLEGLWLSGGNWVAKGMDSAEKEVVLMIDGAKGEVKKLTN
jgi:hypothetical protein